MSTLYDKSIFRILIIKTGDSETLSPRIDDVPSLGDVLRSTPVLGALSQRFPGAHITWFTSGKAAPLLYRNPFIDQVETSGEETAERLASKGFDLICNFEKGICFLEMTARINARMKLGFVPGSNGRAYEISGSGRDDILHYIHNKNRPHYRRIAWQKQLLDMLGIPWNQQPYIPAPRVSTPPVHDVGLNYRVGSKWPSKAMPLSLWNQLESHLSERGFSVSRQQGFNNLDHYLSWIQSCRTVISQDSLGLHAALSYRIPVVGLFGSTAPEEVFFYNRGTALVAGWDCEHQPCYQSQCLSEIHCMACINPADVADAAEQFLKEKENGCGGNRQTHTPVHHRNIS